MKDLTKAQEAAMVKAWNDWHSLIPNGETPAVSLAFEKGFRAAVEFSSRRYRAEYRDGFRPEAHGLAG